VLHKVEEGRLAPVDVVEDEDGRTFPAAGLEEPADRPEGLLGRAARAGDEEAGEVRLDRCRVLLSADGRVDRGPDRVGVGEVGQTQGSRGEPRSRGTK
jgi:hypothetical protein